MKKGKVKACLDIIRPLNSLMVGFAVLVGIVLANNGKLASSRVVAFGYLTGFFISASAMILNDVVDIEIDKLNSPQRPLPSGRLRVKEAILCYIILSIAGVFFAYKINILTFIIALTSWAIATLYDIRGKKSGVPGNIMVAYSVTVPIIFGAASVNRFSSIIWIYYYMIFATVLSREIAKDIADIEGDKKVGAKSLPIIKGPRFAALISVTLYLSAVAISPIPIVKKLVNYIGYGIPVMIVDIGLIYDSFYILGHLNKRDVLRHKKRVLFYMLLGLIGFYLGVKL